MICIEKKRTRTGQNEDMETCKGNRRCKEGRKEVVSCGKR